MKRFLITFGILLLIVSVAGAGVFLWMRNHKTDTVQADTFQALYKGVPLNELQEFLTVSVYEPLTFEVIGKTEYTVKVVPCASARVSYTVSGIAMDFENIEDLTEGFEISRDGNTLSLAPKKSTLAEILSLSYDGAEVTIAEEADLTLDLFCVVISDGETEYRADFSLNTLVPKGVTITPEKVVY